MEYSANYKKGLWLWKNDISVSYGGLAQGEIPWQKTDDRLEINSKVSRNETEGGDWAYAAFMNFRTQFIDGFKLPDDSNIISTWIKVKFIKKMLLKEKNFGRITYLVDYVLRVCHY